MGISFDCQKCKPPSIGGHARLRFVWNNPLCYLCDLRHYPLAFQDILEWNANHVDPGQLEVSTVGSKSVLVNSDVLCKT